MANYADFDHPTMAKRLLALGAGLFLLGALGSALGPALFGGLPAWERSLLVDAELLGIAIAMVGVFGFGVVLPLIE